MKPLVISLCDRTGVMVRDWSVFVESWIVDLQHAKGVGPLKNGVRKIGCDIRDFQLPTDRKIIFVSAFPPCTHLSVSGAAWFKGKGLRKLAFAIELVAKASELCEESEAPYMIENPISVLSSYWRKPDYIFDPCEYAKYSNNPAEQAYLKRTCLWVGGGFKMPKMNGLAPVLGQKLHYLPPSEDRGDLRSVTPNGFATAVFNANYDWDS